MNDYVVNSVLNSGLDLVGFRLLGKHLRAAGRCMRSKQLISESYFYEIILR
jgi:hypothetical protein